MNKIKALTIWWFFILIIIIFYLILLNVKLSNSNWEINVSNQENILKSIVKIEYSDFDKKYLDESEKKWKWIWSWIIFSDDWLILTNNHVVEDSKSYTSKWKIDICIINNIWTQPVCNNTAELLIRNPELDLAILKIKNYTWKNYIKLFHWWSVNTYVFWKTLNIYWYPVI